MARLAQPFHGSGRRHSGALHRKLRHDGAGVCWRHNDRALPLSWRHDSARLSGRHHGGALPQRSRRYGALARWPHHGGALPLCWRHIGALLSGWCHGGALPRRWRSNGIPVRWLHHGGALPLSRRHVGAQVPGRRHGGALPWWRSAMEAAPRRHIRALAAPRWRSAAEPAPHRRSIVEERAKRGMGGRGTTRIARPTGFPVNTWPLPGYACGQPVPQLPS